VHYSNAEITDIVCGTLGLADGMPLEITPINRGGSQRSFSRISCADGTALIFMHYDAGKQENNYYAAIAGFLQKIDVPAPRIFHHDPAGHFLLMEDLGGIDLWHYRQASWDIRRDYYFRTLDIIRRLHAVKKEDSTTVAMPPMMEAFGSELYRWERDYFRQNFVQAVCRIELSVAEAKALEEELAGLADSLLEAGPTLVHRDFQSQNVMICHDEPVLIDFQGMRYGNPLYDLGSLLYDPYVSLSGDEREELLDYYYRITTPGYDFKLFRAMFRHASVQRLMQALGAYGFLGLQGSHPEFLSHIPAGLENLIDAAGGAPGLCHLKNLALHCREAIKPLFETVP